MMLAVLILIPLAAAVMVAVAPASRARSIAMVGMLGVAAMTGYLLFSFDWEHTAAQQFALDEESSRLIGPLGVSVSMSVDSISMMLVALTALLGPICVAASKTAITERVKTYYAWMLVLQSAMLGVFCARDMIFFYTCFEFTLIPMYIMISLWGSTNRKKAAAKFFLYTFTGSVIALAGIVYVAWSYADRHGTWTFDADTLMRWSRSLPAATQGWVLGALLLGFAVKVPLFPFHTWLPLAHTEAPTAGSVILAGVLLKLGTYGLVRFAMPFAPAAFVTYSPAIAAVCVVGILYGGLICWVQTDVKKLVAYSSVAHLGFCVLGLASYNVMGVTGSILYMINHGLSTGALFLLIGMVYERYHTRSMKELGGLASKMPVWSTFMVFFAMASVGLPGLNGFVSEFMCLFGAFQASDQWGAGLWGTAAGQTPGATPGHLGAWVAAIAGTGMVVAAMYLLYMVGKVVWGPLVEPAGHSSHGADTHGHGSHGQGSHGHDTHEHGGLPRDLTGREIGVLVPLAALCIFLGVYPSPVIKALKDPVALTTDEVVNFGKARTAMPLVPPANVAPAGHQDNAGHASDAGQNDVSQHKETAR
ncbi:MAG: NADH-quinone oxidoreductase subunit M [Phycisphaerales bacterium]|nr:NADH-quinone oxidoreductase subunit M [Phycisphaerales bacterium]